MRFTKDDFEEYDNMYFVGHVVDIDGSPWVDEEQLELILEELNDGVSDSDEPHSRFLIEKMLYLQH